MTKWEQWFATPTGMPSVEEVSTWMPASGSPVRRILVLSDIHANWHALTAVLQDAGQHQCNSTWFLGDIIGYGPRPLECVQLFRARLATRGRWIAGNHDVGLMELAASSREDMRTANEAKWTWERHRQVLQQQPEVWRWFCQTMVPPRLGPLRRRYGNGCQVFVHAHPEDPVGFYLYPDESFIIREALQKLTSRKGSCNKAIWLLVGHTHMVCLFRLEVGEAGARPLPITYGQPISINQGRYLINPGSVGQPRDGDKRAAYAVLDVVEGTVTYYRVEYDVISAQLELRDNGYPAQLIERLGSGTILNTSRHYDPVYTRQSDGAGVQPTGIWAKELK